MKMHSYPFRWEETYKGYRTVLEGSELERLVEYFFKEFNRLAKRKGKDMDMMDRLLLGIFLSFKRLYGNRWRVTEKDLKTLSSPDARKLELFHKGLLKVFKKAGLKTINQLKILHRVKTKLGVFKISPN